MARPCDFHSAGDKESESDLNLRMYVYVGRRSQKRLA